MSSERSGGSELSESVSYHIFCNIYGYVLTAVVHRDRVSYHLRKDRRRSGPGLYDFFVIGRVHVVDSLEELLFDEGAFL